MARPAHDITRRLWTPRQRAALAVVAFLLAVWQLTVAWRTPVAVADPPPPRGDFAADLRDRLDPNAATPAELAALPGLGPSRADAIVADRDSHGPFRDPIDLQRVRGIGPGIGAGLAPHLTFGSAHREVE